MPERLEETTVKTNVLTVLMKLRVSLLAATLKIGVWLAIPLWANTFFFSTGNVDGRLGVQSRSASPGKIETEAADDFVLQQTTAITQATIDVGRGQH